MGRSLGVLHATGPEGVAPSAEQVAQLTTLATQAGARIGTVRAFEKTQLQAQTDA
jgi:GAF domain-containing protein